MKEAKQFIVDELSNKTILLALSGGPDSIYLFHLILSLMKKNNLNLICLHVNHGLRKESLIEEEYLKELCYKNNIPIEVKVIKSYKNNKFTEEEARNERYLFFDEMINKYNSKSLLTAHHNDDLLETILMRLIRGSSLKGYAGIKRKSERLSYIIYRPLLLLDKKTIVEYLDKNKIKYFVDNSNLSDNYFRNRIRKILPLLKEESKNINNHIYEYSNLLLETDSYLESVVNKVYNKIYTTYLDLTLFNEQEELIKSRIIMRLLHDTYKDDIGLMTNNNVKEILKVIDSNKPNIEFELSKTVFVVKEYDKLYIKNNLLKEEYSFIFKDYIKLPNNHVILTTDEKGTNNNFCYLNSKDIVLPLIVRTKKESDSIKVLGLNGSKKVKDIFINSKIPKQERDLWPILTDSSGEVLWIPGIKKSYKDKTKDKNYDIIIKYI